MDTFCPSLTYLNSALASFAGSTFILHSKTRVASRLMWDREGSDGFLQAKPPTEINMGNDDPAGRLHVSILPISARDLPEMACTEITQKPAILFWTGPWTHNVFHFFNEAAMPVWLTLVEQNLLPATWTGNTCRSWDSLACIPSVTLYLGCTNKLHRCIPFCALQSSSFFFIQAHLLHPGCSGLMTGSFCVSMNEAGIC